MNERKKLGKLLWKDEQGVKDWKKSRKIFYYMMAFLALVGLGGGVFGGLLNIFLEHGVSGLISSLKNPSQILWFGLSGLAGLFGIFTMTRIKSIDYKPLKVYENGLEYVTRLEFLSKSTHEKALFENIEEIEFGTKAFGIKKKNKDDEDLVDLRKYVSKRDKFIDFLKDKKDLQVDLCDEVKKYKEKHGSYNRKKYRD